VSCVEEFPSGDKAMCQRMASQFEEGHQVGKNVDS
jgi:hypothetical protein